MGNDYECDNYNLNNVSTESKGEESSKSTSSILDINGDGKIDFEDFKVVFGKLRNKMSSSVDGVANIGQNVLKSKAEKDKDAVDNLAENFQNLEPVEQTEAQMMCEKFKAALESTIDLKFAEALCSKQESEKYLTYIDAQVLTASVRSIFKTSLEITPPQVEAACNLSEAILAPSSQEKQNLIKSTIGLAGGSAGIWMVIGGVGSALGWGSGMVASVTAAFVGTSFAGPAGLVVAGVGLAAIAGYFATTSNKQTDTERFLSVLKGATSKAVDAIWAQYGDDLSSAISKSDTVSR